MRKWLLVVCFAIGFCCSPAELCGQFTAPRTYENTPVGLNQLQLAYAYGHSNTSIDTSIIVTGAKLDLNQGSIYYTRYFGLGERLAWVEAGFPLAGLGGSISGTRISGSTNGAGDSSYGMAILLRGGPALSVAEFDNYKLTTAVGMSLSVAAPTGEYEPNKILNLGTGRWAFKPEFAVSYPFGPEQRWRLEGYANAEFYTDNTSYREKEILRQNALPGFEGHISYDFTSKLWCSFDTRYSFRGVTYVNNVSQNNSQQNFILGSEANLSPNARNTFILEFSKALAHQNGPSYTGFAVKYEFTWGKGYR